MVLDGGDDGTFGHLVKRENVTEGELGVLTAVYELSGVETFNGDHHVLDVPVVVRITEDDLSERSSSARVVHNVDDKTLHVTVTLGEVESSELGGSEATGTDGLEDKRLTFTLNTEYSSHVFGLKSIVQGNFFENLMVHPFLDNLSSHHDDPTAFLA